MTKIITKVPPGSQRVHRRVRVAYGDPRQVTAWSYPERRERSVHVEIVTQQGEAIQIVVVVPR